QTLLYKRKLSFLILNFFQLPRFRLVAFLSSWGTRPPTRQKGYLFSHKHFTHTVWKEDRIKIFKKILTKQGESQCRFIKKGIVRNL
ncbi:hypothetical protein, partial [Bacillus sp. MB2021]|uniref:hypothetical protein n=1 Tax=Bacillus sp. MB2021 TaxID=1408303 RepID=UPI0004E0F713